MCGGTDHPRAHRRDRRHHGRGVAVALCLVLPATGWLAVADAEPTAGAEGADNAMTTARIDRPLGYWARAGYAAMVPSIHLPTTHNRDDLIQVWLKVPENAAIDARRAADEDRWQLVLPPGTAADRVEYYRIGGHVPGDATLYRDSAATDPADWTVADVRGTRVPGYGTQRFHVYRPVSGRHHAPLTGWSWPRGAPAAQQQATDALLEPLQDYAAPHRQAAHGA